MGADVIRTYYLLTKPGIIMGNLMTTSAGFLLGSQGHVNLWLFLITMLGLGCVIASACVVNNCIDRHADAKMERTKRRALVTGIISLQAAVCFALLLGVIGAVLLWQYTNGWAFVSAWLGFFIYVVFYSIWKYRTMYATFVGSVAGAMPPVVGYSAAMGRLDLGALILFALLVFWQMPHFFSISVYRSEEYQAASIPVVAEELGSLALKQQTVLYILLFLVMIAMLFFFGYVSFLCLAVNCLIGMIWLRVAFQGFKREDYAKWARQMFRISLIVIIGVSLMISSDRLFWF